VKLKVIVTPETLVPCLTAWCYDTEGNNTYLHHQGNLKFHDRIFACKVLIQANIAGLELGELLHDELFGLFEAMSAIEMMDPKMDAGMLCNRGSKAALNFDQAVEVT